MNGLHYITFELTMYFKIQYIEVLIYYRPFLIVLFDTTHRQRRVLFSAKHLLIYKTY